MAARGRLPARAPRPLPRAPRDLVGTAGLHRGDRLLLPFEAAWVGATLGNHVQDLALTALASFISVAFLQTSADVVLVTIGLLAGHAAILVSAVPSTAPAAAVRNAVAPG